MEGPFYYTYITTNLTRKEKGLVPYLYIGQHCTHNMNDGYYGSCDRLKKDIKAGDKYNVKVIQQYCNIYDLGEAEFNEIKNRKAKKSTIYYNESNTRFYNRQFEGQFSLEHRRKLSIAAKNRAPKTPWNKGSSLF